MEPDTSATEPTDVVEPTGDVTEASEATEATDAARTGDDAPAAEDVVADTEAAAAEQAGDEAPAVATAGPAELESADDIALADKMKAGREQILSELHKKIIGQDEIIEQVLQTLFVGGNSLIVGVPGLAKTLLIQTMAQVLDLKFARIQFTPDLMPSDITGPTSSRTIRRRAGARWCSRRVRCSPTSCSRTRSTGRRPRRSRRCSRRCRSTA